jgi:hypothetical protein
VVAGLALLWYQRGGLTLSRMDQFRSVATSHQPPNSLWQELRFGIVLAIIVAVAIPYLASAYWLKHSPASPSLRCAA